MSNYLSELLLLTSEPQRNNTNMILKMIRKKIADLPVVPSISISRRHSHRGLYSSHLRLPWVLQGCAYKVCHQSLTSLSPWLFYSSLLYCYLLFVPWWLCQQVLLRTYISVCNSSCRRLRQKDHELRATNWFGNRERSLLQKITNRFSP